MKLNDIELDALAEVFNLGVGQAAHALSQLAGEPVQLSVPKIALLTADEISAQVVDPRSPRVCAVRQGFSGEIATEAVLMFPEEQSLLLVQIMVGDSVPLDQLSEMEQEALAEIGNILLNSVVASVADTLGIRLEGSLPEVQVGSSQEVLRDDNRPSSEPLLSLQIRFDIDARQIQGYLAFLLDMESGDTLERRIGDFIAGVTRNTT